jgi:hypothetical protein
MSNDTPYASAVVYMLDRETGKVKPLMMYPIVKVELKGFDELGLTTQKIFTVQGHEIDACWIEEGK